MPTGTAGQISIPFSVANAVALGGVIMQGQVTFPPITISYPNNTWIEELSAPFTATTGVGGFSGRNSACNFFVGSIQEFYADAGLRRRFTVDGILFQVSPVTVLFNFSLVAHLRQTAPNAYAMGVSWGASMQWIGGARSVGSGSAGNVLTTIAGSANILIGSTDVSRPLATSQPDTTGSAGAASISIFVAAFAT